MASFQPQNDADQPPPLMPRRPPKSHGPLHASNSRPAPSEGRTHINTMYVANPTFSQPMQAAESVYSDAKLDAATRGPSGYKPLGPDAARYSGAPNSRRGSSSYLMPVVGWMDGVGSESSTDQCYDNLESDGGPMSAKVAPASSPSATQGDWVDTVIKKHGGSGGLLSKPRLLVAVAVLLLLVLGLTVAVAVVATSSSSPSSQASSGKASTTTPVPASPTVGGGKGGGGGGGDSTGGIGSTDGGGPTATQGPGVGTTKPMDGVDGGTGAITPSTSAVVSPTPPLPPVRNPFESLTFNASDPFAGFDADPAWPLLNNLAALPADETMMSVPFFSKDGYSLSSEVVRKLLLDTGATIHLDIFSDGGKDGTSYSCQWSCANGMLGSTGGLLSLDISGASNRSQASLAALFQHISAVQLTREPTQRRLQVVTEDVVNVYAFVTDAGDVATSWGRFDICPQPRYTQGTPGQVTITPVADGLPIQVVKVVNGKPSSVKPIVGRSMYLSRGAGMVCYQYQPQHGGFVTWPSRPAGPLFYNTTHWTVLRGLPVMLTTAGISSFEWRDLRSLYPGLSVVTLSVQLFGAGGQGGSGSSFSCYPADGRFCSGGGAGGGGGFARFSVAINLGHPKHLFPRFELGMSDQGDAVFQIYPHIGYELDQQTQVFDSQPLVVVKASAGAHGQNQYKYSSNSQCGGCPASFCPDAHGAGGAGGPVISASAETLAQFDRVFKIVLHEAVAGSDGKLSSTNWSPGGVASSSGSVPGFDPSAGAGGMSCASNPYVAPPGLIRVEVASGFVPRDV